MSNRKKRYIVAAVIVLGGIAGGSTIVLANGGGDRISGPPQVDAQGKSICVTGFKSAANQYTPPDNTDQDNVALTQTITNKCGKTLTVDVNTELETGAGGFIHADVYATCLAGACGSTVLQLAPGNTYFQDNSGVNSLETHGMVFMTSPIAKGTWQIDFVVGGDGTNAHLDWRSMVSTFYK
jgi:hypothetical protein